MRGIDLRAVTARCTLEKKEAVRSGAPEERASERGREKAREEEEEAVEEEVARAEQRGRRQEEAEEASAMAVAMASTAQQTLQCKCGLQNTQEKREEEGTQGDGSPDRIGLKTQNPFHCQSSQLFRGSLFCLSRNLDQGGSLTSISNG